MNGLVRIIAASLAAIPSMVAGYYVVHSSVTGPTLRVRQISRIAAAIIGVFLLWGGYIVAFNATRLGWIPTRDAYQVVTVGGFIVAAATTGVGVVAMVRVPKICKEMGRVRHMASVLSSRVEDGREISKLGLTPREFEILEVMSEGSLSNQEISGALSMSPATAGTHIRNILKKAGLKDREDLVVLFLQQG